MMENNKANNNEEFVMVYDSPDQATAEMVCATLQAAGLRAVIQNERVGPAAGWLSYLGGEFGRGVFVSALDVVAANTLLLDLEPTEEEILAEMEAHGMTTEEAEAQVK